MGISTTSLLTLLGTVGLAMSLALQDNLKNLASGLFLLGLRPFSVGDWIQVGDKSGSVLEIGLNYTSLCTIDNSRVYIPNSRLASVDIINSSTEDERRVDLLIPVPHGCDLSLAKQVISRVIENDDRALSLPEPTVMTWQISPPVIEIKVRVWVKASDLFALRGSLIENCVKKLDEAGIGAPYGRVDVGFVDGGHINGARDHNI